ncbi:unnamed protein product [Chondrus crispus]|uniref:Ion channel CASTOR n=1 Tax=Chondrus crispus TaxID=2769 RepID=R7QCL5_CHOCR|nr:unnamed protein product [Chondrus crispus]CDF35819.1 unnamed protein product [Chondrus crispus]|eukprot:XP_005715638.1 unnamed protein product [Chondrus crispus]
MALTWCLILSSGTLISWMASEPWIESLWAAALGSGLDWGFINSTSPSLRLVAVCTNVGGLVLTALLLSIISDAVQTKYDSLRKGESSVTETGHTLIIGWSVKSLSVMVQLAKAGESAGGNVIVCLSDQREKEDMENDIAQCDFSFANVGTRVVCRSGSPLSYQDLQKVSFFRARSIIILGDDENDAETNDARSLQILLSIIVVPRPDRVVIEVMDTENAAIMTSICPELVEPVLANDVLGRLMLQAARNPLVADVWQELLGFDGCETYSGQWGILRGLSFKEVLLCFEDAIPLGVKTASGDLMLNPSDSYVIGDGDQIIVLAEDDDTYCASITHSLIREAVYDPYNHAMRYIERILFCGWRFDMGNLLQVYSAVAPFGSEFWILSELAVEQRESELSLRGWESNSRVKVVHRVGACRRNVLAQLPLETFSSVIVGASDAHSNHLRSSDARVITVVMMIQDITTRRNEPSPDNEARSQRFIGSKATLDNNSSRGVIVGEIVDSRSRAMLSIVNSIDAVVASSELISKAVAMVSEDGSVNRFLNTLFDPHDSEITLESVESYVDLTKDEEVSFFELMARGRNVGTIVLGYLEREIVALNPGEKDLRRGWHPDDLLIVLTQAPSGSSLAPSDFLSDIADIRTMDMTGELGWAEPISMGKRCKVRFRG